MNEAFRYPDFYHIGAYKSASTSLHYYLSQHPQIYMARQKGGNYLAFAGKDSNSPRQFGQKIIREKDYQNLFSGYSGEKMVGESSPHYLASDQALERIHKLRPDARLIVILRNPVEAIYSRYLMRRRDGGITQPFSELLDSEEQVLAGNSGRSRLHLDTAFYGHWLDKYYQRFPAEQIKVQLYDDYLQNRAAQLHELFTFLGVDPSFSPHNQRSYNRSGIPRTRWLQLIMKYRRSLQPLVKRIVPTGARARIMDKLTNGLEKPSLEQRERQRLVDIYREDILRLEKLLQRDLQHWLGE